MPTRWVEIAVAVVTAASAVGIGGRTSGASAARRLDGAIVGWRPASAGAPVRIPWRGRRLGLVPRPAKRGTSELALFVDLVAAGLAAGATVHESLLAVSTALPGGIADRLRPVGASLALGASPAVAWGPVRSDAALRPMAVALVRAATSGAPPADILVELAADLRARRRVAATEAARSAGVRAVAPLGLCFLPAFVLLGVVPTVIGLAGAALSGS